MSTKFSEYMSTLVPMVVEQSNKRVLDKKEAEKIIISENEKNLEDQKKTIKASNPSIDKNKSKKKENKASIKKKAKKVSKK